MWPAAVKDISFLVFLSDSGFIFTEGIKFSQKYFPRNPRRTGTNGYL